MKCACCGRGITWRRVARDAAFTVYDGPELEAEGTDYCGPCFEAGKAEPGPGSEVWIHVLVAKLDYRLHPDSGARRMCRWRSAA